EPGGIQLLFKCEILTAQVLLKFDLCLVVTSLFLNEKKEKIMSEKKVYTTQVAGRELVVEIGQVAKQASAAALLRYGETVVLSTVVGGEKPSTLPFSPLTVNYEEKMYAVGKIPGGFLKREGRPSEHATLTSRLIDRPIRPLFPEGY